MEVFPFFIKISESVLALAIAHVTYIMNPILLKNDIQFCSQIVCRLVNHLAFSMKNCYFILLFGWSNPDTQNLQFKAFLNGIHEYYFYSSSQTVITAGNFNLHFFHYTSLVRFLISKTFFATTWVTTSIIEMQKQT